MGVGEGGVDRSMGGRGEWMGGWRGGAVDEGVWGADWGGWCRGGRSGWGEAGEGGVEGGCRVDG